MLSHGRSRNNDVFGRFIGVVKKGWIGEVVDVKRMPSGNHRNPRDTALFKLGRRQFVRLIRAQDS